MERRIWLYWEDLPGRTKPPHIALCHETIHANAGVPVEVVSNENLRDFLPDIHANIDGVTQKRKPDEVSLAIKADFVRAFLLERYGGLYLDSDAVVLQPLHEVFDAIEEKGFACMRKTSRPQHRIPNNFIGSLPEAPIITMFARHLRYQLERRTKYEWGETGAKTLTPIVNGNMDKAFIFPEHRVHPVINNDQEIFAQEGKQAANVLPADALVCMLFHGIFDKSHHRKKGELADHSLRDLYYGQTLLADIFRQTIDESRFAEIEAALGASSGNRQAGKGQRRTVRRLLSRLFKPRNE
jgi:hypothetical protein